ncbi:nuclear nucleic acid-binding protein c1d [Anaeramoeba flamelloides]|uniref:Nuclear nucleic acid-binding protein C1D n=1 Tax=Anaeramoeba flamelloides TaxID=1746091 RepID=A0AAV7Z8S3_9EUKA|nr:nuclear nucleic acid-binding protein c1d [Anaeramoeba flamelloides]KAJ6240112.1 nuclear nucleic acid-binding protein c1d [Anaeramoeba flamelloides]
MSEEQELLPQEILESLQNFESSLDECEKTLQPILKHSLTEISSTLNPLEQAKLNMSLAYTINSLYFMYLKTQGIDPKNHPVKKEIERVKMYIKKIKDISELKKLSSDPYPTDFKPIQQKQQQTNKKGKSKKQNKRKN